MNTGIGWDDFVECLPVLFHLSLEHGLGELGGLDFFRVGIDEAVELVVLLDDHTLGHIGEGR